MTDWSRVARAVYRVRQHYRYTYSGPVWDMKQRLVMIPRDQEGDQQVLQHDLAIRGMEDGADVTWSPDQFGNRAASLSAADGPDRTGFEAAGRRDPDRPVRRRPARARRTRV